tara:strand:+ start:4007 stop:4828 length:822 start_codon:yes stop_codon:yes gene_type:complete
MIKPGLYLVATPIGNLNDITLRALNILKNSDLILCENTIKSKKIINKYGIKSKLEKYTDHDFDKKKDFISNLINTKSIVSLISDSGSPLISDPGNQLIKYLLDKKINVFSIPGASALIVGIQLSGLLNKKKYVFLGFLPKKSDQKIKILKEQLHNNLVIYTTKRQVVKDIESIVSLSNEYEIVILKELTKIHEERIVINPSNFQKFNSEGLKGELVLVATVVSNENKQEFIDSNEALMLINKFGVKKAYKEIKTKYKISRNDFYKLAVKLKNE